MPPLRTGACTSPTIREAVCQAGGFIEVVTTPSAGKRVVLAFPRLDDGS